jgi:hypothetical protein
MVPSPAAWALRASERDAAVATVVVEDRFRNVRREQAGVDIGRLLAWGMKTRDVP